MLCKILLVVLFLALLAAASAFAGTRYRPGKKHNSGTEHNSETENSSETQNTSNAKSASGTGRSFRLTARKLTFCAIAIALGTVLSNVKLYSFPFGGSVTLLSMLFICLPGCWFGAGTGIITGVAYGILQLLIDPHTSCSAAGGLSAGFRRLRAVRAVHGPKKRTGKGLYRRCNGSMDFHHHFRLDILCGICLGGLESASLLHGLQRHLYFRRIRCHLTYPGYPPGKGSFLTRQETGFGINQLPSFPVR